MNREGLNNKREEKYNLLNGKSVQELQKIFKRECRTTPPARIFFDDNTYKQEIIKAILDRMFSSE